MYNVVAVHSYFGLFGGSVGIVFYDNEFDRVEYRYDIGVDGDYTIELQYDFPHCSLGVCSVAFCCRSFFHEILVNKNNKNKINNTNLFILLYMNSPSVSLEKMANKYDNMVKFKMFIDTECNHLDATDQPYCRNILEHVEEECVKMKQCIDRARAGGAANE
jgi:hypothetical protein